MKSLIMHISIIPNFVAGFLGKLAKALKYIIYTHGLYENIVPSIFVHLSSRIFSTDLR